MLHAVHRDRRGRAFDIEDALDPQHGVAVPVEKHGQPEAEQRPVERPVEDQRKSVNAVAVPVAVMVVRMNLHFLGKPAPREDALASQREEVVREERRSIEPVLGRSP